MDLNRIFMKNASPTKVGGQAILEGLMMQGARAIAIAIREPAGGIHLTVEPIKPAGRWKKLPVIRGVIAFVNSLVRGTGVLLYSAEVLEQLEETQGEGAGEHKPEEKGKFEQFIESKFGEKAALNFVLYSSVVLSIVLSVGVFVILPTVLMNWLKGVGLENVVLLNLIEGCVRIAMFVIYVLAVSRMEEIHRVFQYHGAEHKTIHCYENGLELTPENAQSFYTLHPRCGTSFLMFVMVISLLVFSLMGWPGLVQRILSRLLLIPVVAGLSYELLQFTGRHNNACVKALSLPGIYLQKITTAEPDLKQLEVAIAAMNAVLPSQHDPSLPVEYWVGTIQPDGTFVKDEEATKAYIESKKK
ncbi:MAG: DUF1385 domain-containing protein [Firmicutes bacterium]|nr:DUF1385 domain-containing protein [Bacillota bacterium]